MNKFIKSHFSTILSVPKVGDVLFNTVYGTVDLINEKIKQAWFQSIYTLEVDELNFLQSRGHVVEDDLDDLLISKIETRYEQTQKKCSKFYLVYSLACNFSCFYCFENNQNNYHLITEAELAGMFDAIDFITQTNKAKSNEIVLFGGEPFLERNKPLIAQTLKFALDKGYSVGAITNGSNILAYAELLKKYNHILSCFSVTIDGSKHDHDRRRIYSDGRGSYNDIVLGLQVLKSLDIPLSIRINLDKSYNDDVPTAIAEIEKHLGYKPNINLSLVDDSTCTGACTKTYNLTDVTKYLINLGYFDKNFSDKFFINIKPINQLKALLSSKKPILPRFQYCHIGELYLFSVDGNIYCCPQSCQNNDFKIGQYYPTVSIDKEKMNYFHTINSNDIDICQRCAWAPICGGGCYIKRSYNEMQGKTICYRDDLESAASLIISHYFGV